MATKKVKRRKMLATAKRGRGRPSVGGDEAAGETTKIDVRVSDQVISKLDEMADERGVRRSDVVREVLDEAVDRPQPQYNRARPEDAARRKADRLEMIAKTLDSLGYTETVRAAAIQKLVADKMISEADAKELAKRRRK